MIRLVPPLPGLGGDMMLLFHQRRAELALTFRTLESRKIAERPNLVADVAWWQVLTIVRDGCYVDWNRPYDLQVSESIADWAIRGVH